MSVGRRWRDSIWLVSTLVFGVTTWAGFLYIGAVARRPKWLVAAAVYLAGAVAVLVLNSKAPRDGNDEMIDSTWQATVSSLGLGVLWLGGIVHGLIANRQWLALRPATGVATAAGSASLPGFAPPPIPVATPSFPHPPGARQWSDGTLDQPLASLEIQRTTATRMDAAIDDTVGRLRLLEARMGEAVVRMLELSAQTAPGRALPETTDVTNLLDDIEALRQSLDEVHSLDASNPPIR